MHKKNLYYKYLSSEKILINKNNHIQLMNYGIIKGKNEKMIYILFLKIYLILEFYMVLIQIKIKQKQVQQKLYLK